MAMVHGEEPGVMLLVLTLRSTLLRRASETCKQEDFLRVYLLYKADYHYNRVGFRYLRLILTYILLRYHFTSA